MHRITDEQLSQAIKALEPSLRYCELPSLHGSVPQFTLTVWLARAVATALLELQHLKKHLSSCPGVEIEKGRYSGCGGGEDCPTCHGKWVSDA